jgi:hypothetical protein
VHSPLILLFSSRPFLPLTPFYSFRVIFARWQTPPMGGLNFDTLTSTDCRSEYFVRISWIIRWAMCSSRRAGCCITLAVMRYRSSGGRVVRPPRNRLLQRYRQNTYFQFSAPHRKNRDRRRTQDPLRRLFPRYLRFGRRRSRFSFWYHRWFQRLLSSGDLARVGG